VENYGVDNNHCEYAAKSSDIPKDEVKSRVQNNGLPCNHAAPANDTKGDIDGALRRDLEIPQERTADCIRHNTPSGNKEAPEIEAMTCLKGGKDNEVKFNYVVEGNG
jgi:hypothetical protein